jgi:NADH dehydrogenase
MNKKNIVILGGGFGGITTYKSLPSSIKKSCKVTIIDKRNHFLFTPLLAELAGSSLKSHHVAVPIKDILGSSAEFIQDEVVSIDVQNNTVILKEHDQIQYDFLVSSLGANTFFYGTPGAQEYTHVFKSLQDAIDLKNRCIDIFQQASELNDKGKQKELLTFMIIGGGPTGVEVVTEIAELMFGTLLKKYDNINKEDVSVVVVNDGDTILQMFDKKLSHYAEKSLIKENITVRNNVCIIEIRESSAITKDGEEIFAHTILWTAGVSAIDLNCSCGTFKKERGRIHISKDMRAIGSDNVFVLGDMALFPTEDGRGLPMTAQVARQQGQLVAKNITALIKGNTPKEFMYKEKGLLASLGSFNAIGQISGVRFTGLFAWIMWRGVYLMLFDSWNKRFSIMGAWFKNFFTKRDINRF